MMIIICQLKYAGVFGCGARGKREWEWARSRHVGGERGANNGSNGMGVMMMSQVLLLLV